MRVNQKSMIKLVIVVSHALFTVMGAHADDSVSSPERYNVVWDRV